MRLGLVGDTMSFGGNDEDSNEETSDGGSDDLNDPSLHFQWRTPTPRIQDQRSARWM